MGGLGNGRRGGRSPPLMIGALIACILVLGFNYWVSSSRNLELQTKLYELEGQVRREVAERGVATQRESEFHTEIQKQKEQISRIENLYKRQLEGAQNTCSQEKGTLQLNISTSTKTIQDLKVQLNQLNNDLGKLQKEMQSCQANLNTLNKKITYDMTQCNTQILSQKEQCDERIAAAKLDIQKKMEKFASPAVPSKLNAAPTSKEQAPMKEGEPEKVGPLDDTKMTPVLNHTPSLSQPEANAAPRLLTNAIVVDKSLDVPAVVPSSKGFSKAEPEPLSSEPAAKQDVLPPSGGAVGKEGRDAGGVTSQKKSLTADKDVEVMDVHEEDAQIEETDPGMKEVLIDQEKAVHPTNGQKFDDEDNYDAEEQVVGGVDLEKPPNQLEDNVDKTMEDEIADYNGDEENEGEFEADKQAELAQN